MKHLRIVAIHDQELPGAEKWLAVAEIDQESLSQFIVASEKFQWEFIQIEPQDMAKILNAGKPVKVIDDNAINRGDAP